MSVTPDGAGGAERADGAEAASGANGTGNDSDGGGAKGTGSDVAEAAALVRLAERLAREAGALASEGRARGLSSVSTKSSPTDMVTEYDRAAEALIVEALRRERPGDALVGEEGTALEGVTGRSWLIDPIDGTTNFLYALPGWSVSVAVSDHRGPLAGAVHIPTFGETFTAARGLGAWCNGMPVHVSQLDDLSRALVGTGFSYLVERRTRQAAIVADLLPRVRDIRQLGSAAVHLCMVAAGRLDGFYEEGLNPWDMAAGALIAAEAGAVVRDLVDGPLHPKRVVAATPGIAAMLAEVLVAAGAPVG